MTFSKLIDPEEVHETYLACLAGDEIDVIKVSGITINVAFSSAKIRQNKDRVRSFLLNLPVTFRETFNKHGWSFSKSGFDREGGVWTVSGIVLQELYLLGLAANLIVCTVPSQEWEFLPGRVPYFAIKSEVFN